MHIQSYYVIALFVIWFTFPVVHEPLIATTYCHACGWENGGVWECMCSGQCKAHKAKWKQTVYMACIYACTLCVCACTVGSNSVWWMCLVTAINFSYKFELNPFTWYTLVYYFLNCVLLYCCSYVLCVYNLLYN